MFPDSMIKSRLFPRFRGFDYVVARFLIAVFSTENETFSSPRRSCQAETFCVMRYASTSEFPAGVGP